MCPLYYCIVQEAFASSIETGQDLEHVEVIQKKFDEFQKVGVYLCMACLNPSWKTRHG